MKKDGGEVGDGDSEPASVSAVINATSRRIRYLPIQTDTPLFECETTM